MCECHWLAEMDDAVAMTNDGLFSVFIMTNSASRLVVEESTDDS